MSQGRDVRQVGDRIEAVLGEMRATADPRLIGQAEELVRLLMEFYGAGLERAIEVVWADGEDQAALDRMVDDELVASLMLLHGLHPLSVEERIQNALDKVRPYLGSHAGGVEYLGLDDEGVVHLQLQGSCEGCPSSTLTVKLAIERAILEAAPEVIRVEVPGVTDRPPAPVLPTGTAPLTLYPNAKVNGANGHANGHNGHAMPVAEPGSTDGWTTVGGLAGLAPGTVISTEVGGADVVVCHTGGNYYAYLNACARCGSAWTASGLDGDLLTCPTCQRTYDVRLAGRSPDDSTLHLNPLPLLADGGAVRIAVIGGVA